MTSRRDFLSLTGTAAIGATLPEGFSVPGAYPETKFRFCLNTSTVSEKPLDIMLGRETGVMPQLEFWGASDVLWHIGQVIMIVSIAGDKDARILPDVYHMFRGNSSFDNLKMIDGSLIEIFHFNDFITSKPRKEQNDSDRVYPGDGAAPFKDIISRLKMMGGEKVLSLELFNESYWKDDPLSLAKTGLKKMKAVTSL